MAPPTGRTTRNNSQSDLSIDQKLDLLLNDVSEIKNDNKQFKLDIADIKEDLKQFKQDINESIDLCFKEIKDCVKATNKNREQIQVNEQTIDNVRLENNMLKKKISELQKMVQADEQYARSNCLEIVGVPESEGEVVLDLVKRVARAVSFPMTDEMIDAVHRLSKNPNNPQAPRGIIVKFCRRIDMEELRKKAKVKSGFSAAELGFQSESEVYINLSLTRETRALWAEVRSFKKEREYKYAWITSAGKMFVRKAEGTKAVLISEKADLDRLK